MNSQKHKSVLFFFYFILFSQLSHAQTFHRNTVFAELGSNALFTSVNYERQLLQKPKLAVRAGVGIYGIDPSVLTLPVGINYLLRVHKSNYFLDVGFGATYTQSRVELYAMVETREPYVQKSFWNFIPSVGFRKQSKNLMIRINASLVANEIIGMLPFAGFSIGRTF